MSTKKETAKLESIKWLKKMISPSKGILIVQKSVSRSGMQRGLEIYSVKNNQWLTSSVADVLGWGRTKEGYLKVTGCGMDMHFATAYTLTQTLYTKEEQENLTGNGRGCLPWKSI